MRFGQPIEALIDSQRIAMVQRDYFEAYFLAKAGHRVDEWLVQRDGRDGKRREALARHFRADH